MAPTNADNVGGGQGGAAGNAGGNGGNTVVDRLRVWNSPVLLLRWTQIRCMLAGKDGRGCSVLRQIQGCV